MWRTNKNKICELKDSNGVSHSYVQTMSTMINEYFQSVFSADPNLDALEVLDLIAPKVTEADNERLTRPFTDDEIADALFQIGALKATGSDGFPAQFFQRNWDTLKVSVIAFVREFLVSGVMLDGVNSTSIVLIPNITNPTKLIEYRPISLCNVITR